MDLLLSILNPNDGTQMHVLPLNTELHIKDNEGTHT
jgi:hypothetical protein